MEIPGIKLSLDIALLYHILRMGPSIDDVGNWEGEGSKIGQNCKQIVLRKLPTWRSGDQKSRKIADIVYKSNNICQGFF